MNAVFSLLEHLVALGRPTIVGLQSLLGMTLLPVSGVNQYWSLYEAHQSSGFVASVDFREPARGASKHEPLLVVTLRDAPVRLQDLSQKHEEEKWGARTYRGQPRMSDYLEVHSLLVQRKNVDHLLRAGATYHDRRRIVQYFAIGG